MWDVIFAGVSEAYRDADLLLHVASRMALANATERSECTRPALYIARNCLLKAVG